LPEIWGREQLPKRSFSFSASLTTEPNAVVAPIHTKAMPIILTTPEDIELWMTAPAKEALALQRLISDDALRVVARSQKQDPSP
jgi:putative SOS response-associated peptidase YedK